MTDFDETIGLGDTHGTRFEVTVTTDEGDDLPVDVQLGLGTGISGGRGFATPKVCRQMAATLLDAADKAEGQS